MFKRDLFVEKIVRRVMGPFEIFIKSMIVLTAFTIIMVLNVLPFIFYENIMGFMLALSFGVIYLAYRLFISIDTEYEYSLTNDDFTIDRIVAKRKRSQIFTASCKDFQMVAPVDSEAYFEALKSNVLLFDYSSGRHGTNMWFFLLEHMGKKKMIVFDFDPRFIEGFRKYNPRKVEKIDPDLLEKEEDQF